MSGAPSRGLTLAHVPEVMVPERDFTMFRVRKDARLYFWFRVCPICGLRADEPSDAPDEVELMQYTPDGQAPIPYGLHGGCARAIGGRTGRDDVRVLLVGLACLKILESLQRAAKIPRAAFGPGSGVSS